jgi:hypothetical protein
MVVCIIEVLIKEKPEDGTNAKTCSLIKNLLT